MATPTRDAVANDLGERCQIIIGRTGSLWGYLFANNKGTPAITFKPQKAKSSDVTYISTSDHLTMRDSEDSRIFMNDWRRGAGQASWLVDDPISKARFYDSVGMVVSDPGRMFLANAMPSVYSATVTNTAAAPVCAVGNYLYLGVYSAVNFSALWGGAPTSAATSSAGGVNHLVTDSTYVYGAVQGVGVNRWTIGSANAGTAWETTKTVPQRLLYANRKLYEIDGSAFYEIALSNAALTTDFTPPAGWTLMDLCARRGGSIDAPILLMARSNTPGSGSSQGQKTIVWYWDGTTIHDYIALPTNFAGKRMIQYNNVIYIYGALINADGTISPRVYYILNDTLGLLGDLGVQQSNGNPTSAGVVADANWGMDAGGQFVYFSVNATGNSQEVWKYDTINGGLTRHIQASTSASTAAAEIAVYGGGPWMSAVTAGAVALFGTASTYVTTGRVDTSDLHLGMPWDTNIWLSFAFTFSQLTTGQRVAFQYSTNQGTTWTPAAPTSDGTYDASFTIDGAISNKVFVLSTTTTTVASPYIRIRLTVTSGATQTTTPSVYSIAIKADPQDPTGAVIECDLACSDDQYTPNDQPDWQGGSGTERMYNIVNSYNNQLVLTCIYMGPAATRAKNPTTINALIVDYNISEWATVGFGPSHAVEGNVHVVLREVAAG